MKRPASNSQDAAMACQSAEAFYRNAGQFFSRLPKDLNASAAFVYERRGELVVAVTNLSLALELYLKALALVDGVEVKRTHDLLKLFNTLTEKTRISVAVKYSAALQKLPPAAADAIELGITTTPYPPTPEEIAQVEAQRPSGDDIESVLSAEKDAFRTWRYIHEFDLPHGFTMFRVDFHKLALIASALQQQLAGK